jgi:predicted phosphohydrolase
LRLRDFLLTERDLNEHDHEVLTRVGRLQQKVRQVVEKETQEPEVKVLMVTHYMIINGLKEPDGINPVTGKMANRSPISYCQAMEFQI